MLCVLPHPRLAKELLKVLPKLNGLGHREAVQRKPRDLFYLREG